MGEEMNGYEERDSSLFNTPLEISLRCMFLLSKFHSEKLSIDKLIYLDYFIVHSSDVIKKSKSLHPKYPFRSTEIVVKREVLNKALILLISKELIKVGFSDIGIDYQISDIGMKVLQYFESPYAKLIKEMSELVYNNFKDYTEQQLLDVINSNIEKWGSEFTNESKFRGKL